MHYTYRFKPDKEKKLNFTYHPGTNTYTTPPVERKSTSPPILDDQRNTPEKRDSPIPDTPPRLDLEENRDPDPDRINLNPVGPELNPIPEINPIIPEGPVIPNIPEVIPETDPEPISEAIPEDPEPLEPEPEIIPPEIIEDIEMPGGDQPKYQPRDLPKFGGEKTEDPIEFVYQFENFLRYISHEVNDNASVEKALTYLGQCLSSKARDWFQTHVGPPKAADHGRSKAEYEQLLKDFKKCFHPMGKTTEQLEMAWANIKWNPTTESIEEFVSKIKQLATVLGKTQEDQVQKIKMSSPSAEVYRLIMQCTTIENIINLINQMQAMNFQSVQPSMPNTVMPFMAAQIDAQKQVTFSSPLDHKVEKMADKLDMLTENMTQETGHGPEEETEGIEVMIDNIEVETGVEIIIEIVETIGIETIGTQDQTEVIDQEAIIEKDIMVTIVEGQTIVLDVTVIKVAIIIRDLRIEVTLMAEGTQEEILHVLMIVYSPCRTP